ncbi:alpha/beta hydrolase [Streptomyces niveus]|uniref:alpha/beta fold hydrolase n=1 Tax=Streptomyces niveus TaxID=193462 RepID=UPI003423D752
MGKETRTKVLVHGLPETSAVWEPLLEELVKLGHRDVVRLSPPAFGAPWPDGFSATVEGYQDWLVGELSAFGAPVDLVGHDFGGVHAVNVAISRPDLLHSWVSDVAGVFEPDYVWHPYVLSPIPSCCRTSIDHGSSVAPHAKPVSDVRRALHLSNEHWTCRAGYSSWRAGWPSSRLSGWGHRRRERWTERVWHGGHTSTMITS